MKQFIPFLLVGFLLISCKEDTLLKEAINSSKDKSNKIVLIFKNPPQNWKYTFDSGVYMHHGKYELSYMKEPFIPVFWTPDYSKKDDTLIISTNQSFLEIKHKYLGLDEFTYLLNPGDTAIFSYTKKLPSVKLVNRKYRKYDFAFDSLKRKMIVQNDFPGIIKYDFPSYYFKMKWNLDNLEKVEKRREKNQIKIIDKEYFKEKKILDSLYKKELLSRNYRSFYKDKLFYDRKRIALKEGKMDSAEFQGALSAKNQPLLKYSFYRNFVEEVAKQKFYSTTKLIKSSNASIYDYRTVYDSVETSTIFSKQAKKYLLKLYLEKIIKNFQIKDVNTYFKKFTSRYSDTILNNYLVKKYKLKDTVSNQMKLLNATKRASTFAEFLKKSKGKVIYVDYWASWCKPCRAAMPASHELRKKLEEENVVFLYLAFNDRYDPWIEAMEQIGLNDYENSFLINNTKYSQLIIDLDIPTIPRYMIYDKQGELVHKNAPGPKSEQLVELLKRYIAE